MEVVKEFWHVELMIKKDNSGTARLTLEYCEEEELEGL